MSALMLLPALAAALPVVALLGVQAWATQREARRQLERLLDVRVKRLANDAADYVGAASRGARFLAGRIATAPGPGACQAALAGIDNLDAAWSNAAVLRPDGTIECESNPWARRQRNYAGEPWFAQAVAGRELAIGSPVLAGAGRPVIHVAAGIGDGRQARGVALIELDLRAVAARFGGEELPPGSTLSLADRRGRIVARYPEHADDSIPRLVLDLPVPSLEWRAAIGVPLELVQAPIHEALWRSALALMAATGLGVLLAMLLARCISRPLMLLARTAEAVEHGDADARVPVVGTRELAVVAHQFNRMLDHQQCVERDLRRATNLYEALARANGAVARGGRFEEVAAEICRACVDAAHAARIALVVREAALPRLVAVAGSSFDDWAALMAAWESDYFEGDTLPLPTALREGRTVVCNDYGALPARPAAAAFAESLGVRSVAAVPLVLDGRTWGALVVHGERPAWFDAQRVRLFTAIADDLAHLLTSQQREAARLDARAAQLAAEAANRAKSVLLANVSHELRTPIHAILGFNELALHTPLAPRQYEYLQKATLAADSLLASVNQILDLCNLEAGQFTPASEDFALAQLLEPLRANVAQRALARGLAFRIEVDAQLPPRLVGDRARLLQVLANLAGNAVKFTDAGEVVVALRVASRDGDTVHVLASVRDTGIGMGPEDLRRVFQPFEQVDGSASRRHGGAGLGLAISRHVVRGLGGTLEAGSVPGAGSEFHFTVPLRVPQAPARSVGREAALRGRRVLVVDDNAVNLELASLLLSDLGGMDVTTAEGGDAALREARERDFDVVLMDLQMPGMDGYATARALNERPGRAPLPIVALTAHASDEVRAACLEAGMVDCVGKAGGERTLLDALARNLA